MQSNEELRKKAAKRADDKIGFYVHFAVYVVMNLFIFFTWFFTTGEEGNPFPWFLFTLVPWGIGLAAHFVVVFVGGNYRQKLTEKEYAKLRDRTE